MLDLQGTIISRNTRSFFAKVKTFSSNDFPRKYQVFIYTDRMGWPTPERPLAHPMEGEKHMVAQFVTLNG